MQWVPVIRSAAAHVGGVMGRAWCVLCQFWASCTCKGASSCINSLDCRSSLSTVQARVGHCTLAPQRRPQRLAQQCMGYSGVSTHAAGAVWLPLVELVLKSSTARAVACRACSMCRSCGAPPHSFSAPRQAPVLFCLRTSKQLYYLTPRPLRQR